MSVQTNTPTGNKIDINVKAIIHYEKILKML